MVRVSGDMIKELAAMKKELDAARKVVLMAKRLKNADDEGDICLDIFWFDLSDVLAEYDEAV